MSADRPIYFSFSRDGRFTHVDSRRVPVHSLNNFVTRLVGSSESEFTIRSQQSKNEVVLIDNQQLTSDPTDPEGDALFLEHIVEDELCLADYLTIEKTENASQQLMPASES